MITLLFHHDPDDWISRLMAWFTRSCYTHVALLSPGGDYVLEATGASEPTGVRYLPTWLWQSRHPGFVERVIEGDERAVWQLASTQIGAGYDWGYLVGWLVRRNWQEQNRFVCSELIAWACTESGTSLFPDGVNRNWITVHDLYLISKGSKSEE